MSSNFHAKNCKCNSVDYFLSEVDSCEMEYKEKVETLESIELLIVGNEPYPSGSNGIAFCNNSWNELMNGRCGGRYLLCSLGIDFSKIKSNYKSPVSLFMKMANKGIVCVNQNDELLSMCLEKKSKVSITCGSKISSVVVENVKKSSERIVKIDRHPSPQGESNPPDKQGTWYKYWGTFENILKILEPSGKGPIHDAINEINSHS